jgi:DNA-binding CsgD family transcriptional regulator
LRARFSVEDIANLIASIGTRDFGTTLDRCVSTITPFDMATIFIFSFDARPLLLHDGYTAQISRKALENYLSGGYLLDPFYVASSHNHPSGLWRMSELAPDSFFSSDFLVSADVHPCVSAEAGSLVEEIGFLVPVEQGLTAAYSLMRTRGTSAFPNEEIQSLKVVKPIIEKAISKHWRHERPKAFRFRSSVGTEDMEGAFTDAFADILTPKQRDIARMILRGHSSLSISAKLGISEGTAKLHRANIYARLGISSQGELFRKFLDYLTGLSPEA